MYKFSAIEIRDQFIRGDVSASAITQHYLNRIAKYDQKIGAFLSVYEEQAMMQAKQLDQKRLANQPLGKLAGIPIAIKDNILVKGEISTCGSKFLTNFKSPYQASVIEYLLAEGAVIIGKTNMDEFAMGSSTENSALQKTSNPWNLKCTPGGSSGGSAAAVAGRLSPLSLGSDTGGSVRLPASFCGVVGFKPTYGRVSRFGLVAYGSSLDQIGPLATNTADTALLMEVIGRHCPKDSTSIALGPEDYLSQFKDSIAGMKIGVPWEFLENLADEPKKIFQQSVNLMKQLGAEIVDIDLSILKYSLAVYYILATAEASTNLARFDGIRYGQRSPKAKTLEEVYDFSKEEGFGAEVKRRILLGTYVLSAGYQDAYYKKAQKVRTLILRSYKEAFAKCDLIASPVSPFAAFEIGAIKDPLQMYLEDIYTIGINLAGLPAVSIPNGFSKDGKPMGLQLIGAQKHDREVLNAAHILEKSLAFHPAIPELVKEETSA
ncbi:MULTISPECIES: Asp-tRNA(Asn)/Glu-tRNA(Gln) amidotransferase subunit GatA [Candidatus Protochlamydia]|uniref:Glutamyl-tRNA(Gln) amidotransferase subunit A n=1 Tax=Protochlamydia amoebophila (strain UWE25) TaxID=264201 RepID=GATA_PARUW|nr:MULTISPECIES: Asp-tRNA(Asn)/Glu-tRNA(Gln) amidotransferase subunit GatA [Protochlamydia]Q6MDF5.1 RecName: Full=Glutamyl-tRNA(Gln) amidotransferase subunit A; Short=Glu-ADT subunit A [Candidatus Protochlamydia amoebophila UWE25]CAF23394.1 gatA [Candidatus Protochlamydia amoebophila UWE25]